MTSMPGATREWRRSRPPAGSARILRLSVTASGAWSGRQAAARRTVPAALPPIPRRTPTPHCSIRAACSRYSNGTSPATPRAGGAGLRVPRICSQVCRLVTDNSGRDRTTAFVYSLGWTQHTVGVQYIRTAPRSCRHCLATSADPAAASWRCAATPPFRGRRISRRCLTCCPATCRCRTPTGMRISTPTCGPSLCRRGTGRTPGPTWSAC